MPVVPMPSKLLQSASRRKMEDNNNDWDAINYNPSKKKKSKSLLEDLQGMFTNFDDVVDDFFNKRMGAGEQWYGKRKYNPSGRVDGDYNGMGRSDWKKIEFARMQRDELVLRRLQEEQASQSGMSERRDRLLEDENSNK